jgi:hypothetical protein
MSPDWLVNHHPLSPLLHCAPSVAITAKRKPLLGKYAVSPRSTSIYASNLSGGIQEEFYGVKVTIADRNMVESESDIILNAAEKGNAAFLVVGDAFGYVQ